MYGREVSTQGVYRDIYTQGGIPGTIPGRIPSLPWEAEVPANSETGKEERIMGG